MGVPSGTRVCRPAVVRGPPPLAFGPHPLFPPSPNQISRFSVCDHHHDRPASSAFSSPFFRGLPLYLPVDQFPSPILGWDAAHLQRAQLIPGASASKVFAFIRDDLPNFRRRFRCWLSSRHAGFFQALALALSWLPLASSPLGRRTGTSPPHSSSLRLSRQHSAEAAFSSRTCGCCFYQRP
jgi:hypothetical protein